MTVVAMEPLSQVLREAAPLLRRHYATLGLPYEFDPDFATFLHMERIGRFGCVTARNSTGVLVGYCTIIIISMLTSRNVNVAMLNAIFIDAPWRGGDIIGNMLRVSEAFALQNKCVRIETGPQGPFRHGIGKLLKRRGWVDSPEPVYWKVLNGRSVSS